MQINVNDQELQTIGKGLSLLPWIEVNDLLMKLSEQQQASKAADQFIQIEAAKPIAVHHSMVGKNHAPYGLKKDGTPAKRRGRPAKRGARK